MSQKTPQCSAAALLDPNKPSNQSPADSGAIPAAECPNFAHQNGGTSSSPESGSSNGDTKRSGKRRRSKKSTRKPETPRDADVHGGAKTEDKSERNASPPPERQAGPIALQAECANVWFQRSVYERAESLYQCWLANSAKASGESNGSAAGPPNASAAGEVPVKKACRRDGTQESSQSSASNSRCGSVLPRGFVAARAPEEGHHRSPAPPTPVSARPRQRAPPPTTKRALNGLSPVFAEMFGDIWLEKPLYDRAEAAFYQSVFGNNSRQGSSGMCRPQSSTEAAPVEQQRPAPQAKAEVFHALHPIQEEDEPAETLGKQERLDAGVGYFLHPDGERVWLDKWRYDAAEMRFHACRGAEEPAKARRPKTDDTSSRPDVTVRPGENNMSAVNFPGQEKIWFEKSRYDEAERRFFERVAGSSPSAPTVCDAGANAILQDIARARENIQKSLAGSTCSSSAADQEMMSRIKSLELENKSLYRVVEDLRASFSKLECRVAVLEKSPAAAAAVAPAAAPSVPYTNGTAVQQTGGLAKQNLDDDDDLDLFDSDDDDEEAEKLKEQRLKDYAERKAKKPGVIAKSSILLDVKPWDDETDMAKLEECVRSVQADGLLWGMSKLVPVGYGIKKLQISCVVEDDKVGTDLLEEEITKFEDYVQSVDVAAFNKI
ncbi:uncharacterized protein LOC109525469 [Hippocampus comes]|uniref:uncharacterized protein LOC109525469 n=1 Tax=Hippocampus comes TaxID=109280 RepID=UPI00094EF86C|nr:PREDICTED: elongation factor 1-delta [Hippocampus comes]